MPKRREFLVRTAALVLASGLVRSYVSKIKASTNDPGGRRPTTFFVGGLNASDSNPGTAAEPFATIQAAANVAAPGAEVRIRDGIYRETVVPTYSATEANPIVFTADTRADGTLAEPVISGAELVTTPWVQTTGTRVDASIRSNVYETTLPAGFMPALDMRTDSIGNAEADVLSNHNITDGRNTTLMAHQVFVRSKMMQVARWPHIPFDQFDEPMNEVSFARQLNHDQENSPAGTPGRWTTAITGSGADRRVVITDLVNDPARSGTFPNLPANALVGAYVQLVYWYVPRATIVLASSGRSFTASARMPGAGTREEFLAGLNGSRIQAGVENDPNRVNRFRYIIRNALALLASEGEWFYEQSSRKLFLWAPGGVEPQDVEIKARNYGFDLTGKSHIHLKNLNFFGCEIPTNGDSLWPSNAKEWVCEDQQPNLYTNWETGESLEPTIVPNERWYPTVQAKADALGYVAGAFSTRKNDPTAVPDPSNGILIDYCRFKYLNHQHNQVGMPGARGGYPQSLAGHTEASRAHSELLIQDGNANINFGNWHRCGMRLTGDNCIIRNSVLNHSGGNAIVATGRNINIENNWIGNAGYIGNFSGGICTAPLAFGLRIYGNTIWRTGRGGIYQSANYSEVSFNDISEYCYINADGGANYAEGRAREFRPHRQDWNVPYKESWWGELLLGPLYRPQPEAEATAGGHFMRGSRWHHNWLHSTQSPKFGTNLSVGLYFDDATDGAVADHNVNWNTNGMSSRVPNSEYTIEKFRRLPFAQNFTYNNVYGTPHPGANETTYKPTPQQSSYVLNSESDMINRNGSTWGMRNNAFRSGGVVTFSQVDPFGGGRTDNYGIRRSRANPATVWYDHIGAYNSDPGNGKPWTIGFGPGQYPQGLGFVPASATSPLVGRGISINNATWPAGEGGPGLATFQGGPLRDGLARPIDYVDDPAGANGRCSGAYEFNISDEQRAPGAPRYYNNPGHPAHNAWIPGCTLPQEFVEGQPWERQWAT